MGNVALKIISFIKKEFKKRKKDYAIIGRSGGLDSEVVYELLKRAQIKIIELSIPAKSMNFEVKTEDIGRLKKLIGSSKEIVGNMNARLRMVIQYAVASNNNGLVVGTEDASEYWLGYFTRWGDQGCDIAPIQKLFKTEVRELARYLKLPEVLISKPSSPDLWPGQTAEGELGFAYKDADPILKLYCLKKLTPDKIIKKGFDRSTVEKVIARVNNTKFKREKIPTCKI